MTPAASLTMMANMKKATAINKKQQPTSSSKDRDEMLARFLTCESLNDIILQGTDGVQVPANRFLLAARSNVFMGMLLGKFQESSLPVVELGFSGSVIKAVVEFVLTDTAQVLVCKNRDALVVDINEQIEALVSLAEAAPYFDLAGLTELVFESFEMTLNEHPCSAFAALQACRMAGIAVPEEFVKTAKSWVQMAQPTSVTANHVACLSTSVMEEILMDPEMEMTEYELFQMLSLWAAGDPGRRKAEAADLCNHISLERISLENLATTVATSGLATSDQLGEAYKNHAFALQKLLPPTTTTFEAPRKISWFSERPKKCADIDPIAIKVEGAGIEAVNGVYTREGQLFGLPKYVMHGYYKGNQCDFCLCSEMLFSGRASWYIELHAEANPHLDRCHTFYKAISKIPEVLPDEGWSPEGDGTGSSPSLLFKFC